MVWAVGMTNHLGLPSIQDVGDNPCQIRADGHPKLCTLSCVEDLGRNHVKAGESLI